MSSATLERPGIDSMWVHQARTESEHWPEEDEARGARPDVIFRWVKGAGTYAVVYELKTPTVARPLATLRAISLRQYLMDTDPTPSEQFEQAGLGPWQSALQFAFAIPELELLSEVPPAAAGDDDALHAADELRAWLDLTYDDLAAITGIAKNTFHHWRRTGARPRPSTARRLWRVHALVRALIARLGRQPAVAWLRTGPRSPLSLLLEGDLEGAEEAAHALLFRHPTARPDEQPGYAPFHLEPEFEVRAELPAAPLRRAPRRPTRGRRPGS